MAAHKKELLEAFKPAFKEHGFKKNGATWVRENSEVFCVFNVQTSQWSELYYFNAGVYVKAVAPIGRPTEPDCHLRTRLPQKEEETKICADLADFENQRLPVAQKIEKLQRLVTPAAFDWFSRHDSVSKLRSGLAARPKFSPPATVALLRYLGLPLPK
jgi:hypothetical protein